MEFENSGKEAEDEKGQCAQYSPSRPAGWQRDDDNVCSTILGVTEKNNIRIQLLVQAHIFCFNKHQNGDGGAAQRANG